MKLVVQRGDLQRSKTTCTKIIETWPITHLLHVVIESIHPPGNSACPQFTPLNQLVNLYAKCSKARRSPVPKTWGTWPIFRSFCTTFILPVGSFCQFWAGLHLEEKIQRSCLWSNSWAGHFWQASLVEIREIAGKIRGNNKMVTPYGSQKKLIKVFWFQWILRRTSLVIVEQPQPLEKWDEQPSTTAPRKWNMFNPTWRFSERCPSDCLPVVTCVLCPPFEATNPSKPSNPSSSTLWCFLVTSYLAHFFFPWISVRSESEAGTFGSDKPCDSLLHELFVGSGRSVEKALQYWVWDKESWTYLCWQKHDHNVSLCRCLMFSTTCVFAELNVQNVVLILVQPGCWCAAVSLRGRLLRQQRWP